MPLILGTDSNDTLSGSDGPDSIFGDMGADRIDGGAGNDTLEGGSDNDTLTGENGVDSYLYRALSNDGGHDRISDFSAGETIQILALSLSGTVTAGLGIGLGLGQVQVLANAGVSGLFVGLDTVPGADLQIELTGNHAPQSFILSGNDITLAPMPALSVAGGVVLEPNIATAELVFTISLSAPSATPVSVAVISSDGTASALGDYSPFSSLVTIPAGQTSANVTIQVFGDTIAEFDETVIVTLSGPVNAILGAQYSTVGTIANNDIGLPIEPSITISPASVVEGDDGTALLLFTANLSGPSNQGVVFTATTGDGTALAGIDYVATSLRIAFPPFETTASFAVPILGDAIAEADETFTVTLSDPGNGVLGVPSSATGTLTDDDDYIIVLPTSVAEGNNGQVAMSFTIELPGPAAQTTTVDYRTVDGSAVAGADFAAVDAGAVTIAAGLSTGTISIQVTGDAVLEGDESFAVELTGVSGDPDLALGPESTAFGTILNDDDGPPIAITGATSAGNAAPNQIDGTPLNDQLQGAAGNDTLSGLNGADLIDGGAGDDLLRGDTVLGGDDSILGGDGADTAFGGDGADTMLGGGGGDAIVGGGGGDTIFGGSDRDILFGGPGGDFVDGEDDDDAIVAEGGADSLAGGAGDDRIHITAATAFASGGDGTDVLILTDAGVQSIDLGNDIDHNATGSGPRLQDFEIVDASGAGAAIAIAGATSGDAGNVLIGGLFRDTIAGSPLADVISGGADADSLAGGGGDDAIFTGVGNDTVSGGGGADSLFYAGAPNSAVRVTDFVPAEDTVLLPASLSVTSLVARLSLADGGGNTVLSFGTGGSITFVGLGAAAFTSDDFVIV